ncbi:MAG TPA: peptidase T, partial [Bacteroidales bacterium]|nr:peptidase T [Bacteroidales bacterium]
MKPITDRFFSYVKIDTQSDETSDTTPSTDKQLNLARLLLEELKKMGLRKVSLDDNGYVMAYLP